MAMARCNFWIFKGSLASLETLGLGVSSDLELILVGTGGESGTRGAGVGLWFLWIQLQIYEGLGSF